jgi:hypothetical protein
MAFEYFTTENERCDKCGKRDQKLMLHLLSSRKEGRDVLILHIHCLERLIERAKRETEEIDGTANVAADGGING